MAGENQRPLITVSGSGLVVLSFQVRNFTLSDQGYILLLGKGTLFANLKLCWHSPEPSLTTKVPDLEAYDRKSIFLWMPQRMWNISFKCPKCNSMYGLR